jgi:hypothetical protein
LAYFLRLPELNLRVNLNFTPGPQGWKLSLGVNTLYYLEECRGKQIIPPGDNFTSRG